MDIKLEIAQIEADIMMLNLKLHSLKEKEKEQRLIAVNDIIVYHSGTELQLCAVHHKQGKTLILVNLDTGTIYRQKFNHDFPSSSMSNNDLVVPFEVLVFPLHVILQCFGIKETRFSHIKSIT